MRGKELKFGTDARSALFSGIDKLEKSVITTLGPKGRNVLIDKGHSHPVITKDGVSVAREIYFSDNYENAGAAIIKEAAEKTNTIAGDGPQPLWAKVLTPNGFVDMGDIKKGDQICGTEGTFQTVLEVFDKGLKHLYRVKFNDGSVVECSGDHLWNVVIRETESLGFSGKRDIYSSDTIPLSDIIENFDKKSFYVSRSYANFYERYFGINPFILGLLYKNKNINSFRYSEIDGITKIVFSRSKIKKCWDFLYYNDFLSTEEWKNKNYTDFILNIFKELTEYNGLRDWKYNKCYNYDNVVISAETKDDYIILNLSGFIFVDNNGEVESCNIYKVLQEFLKDDYINSILYSSDFYRRRLLFGIICSAKESRVYEAKNKGYKEYDFSILKLSLENDKSDVVSNLCKSLGLKILIDKNNVLHSTMESSLTKWVVENNRLVNKRTDTVFKTFLHPVESKKVSSSVKESFNKIVEIEDMKKNVQMRCIKVSNPDHLYFTNDYILTHNTSTTVLFSSELIRAGIKLINNGCDPIEVQRGYDEACRDVKEILDKNKKSLEGEKDIESIATISANNDEEVGKIVKEAFCGIGEGGIVNIGDNHSKSGKTEVKFSDGLEFFRGLKSSVYMNNLQNECFDVENPLVLILDCYVDSADMSNILNFVLRSKRPFVLIASDIDDILETQLYQHAKSRQFNCALIQAPGNTPYEVNERLKDIAVMLNTKIIETKEDLKEFNGNIDFFGTCGRLISKINKTTIEGSIATEEQIQARVDELNKQITDGKNDTERGISEEEIKSIKSRIASLTGGIATIQIGGFSEVRIKELKDRYEDSVRAVESAISDGILAGGGVSLCKSAFILKNSKKFGDVTNDFKSAYYKFLEVCKIPITTIISSVTSDYAYIISNIEHNENFNYGYNAKKEVMSEDMIKDGIVDPALVTKTALTYSTDVAGVFITTECVLTNERNDNISLEPNDPIMERQPTF